MKEIKEKGINEVIEEALLYLKSVTKHIHLSFDIDSLDPQFCPGTGVPVLGGLSVEETLSAFTLLRESNLIIGMDVVEINPLLDKDNLTSKVAITLIKEFFKK
jgi:arginase